MWDTFGQKQNSNFFNEPMSTHINSMPKFSFGVAYIIQSLLYKKFKHLTDWPNMTGLSDVAKFKNDGTEVKNPKAPFALVFQPSSKLQKKCVEFDFEGDNYGCLSRIPINKRLYKIFAVHEPVIGRELKDSDLKLIGKLRTASHFRASKFVDEQVGFRHVFWEEEIRVLKKTSTWGNRSVITPKFQQNDGAAKYKSVFPDGKVKKTVLGKAQ